MTHLRHFQRIPMSKSMRGLCKEEDFIFLGETWDSTREVTDEGNNEEVRRYDRNERARLRLQWAEQEAQKRKDEEESKLEKQRKWRAHITELSQIQEKTLQDRLARIRRFRVFQRKVLEEERGKAGVDDRNL